MLMCGPVRVREAGRVLVGPPDREGQRQYGDYLFCSSRQSVSTLNDHFKGEPIKLQICTN